MRIFYAGPVTFFSPSTFTSSNFEPASTYIRSSYPVSLIVPKKFTSDCMRVVFRVHLPNRNIQLAMTNNRPGIKIDEINNTHLLRRI